MNTIFKKMISVTVCMLLLLTIFSCDKKEDKKVHTNEGAIPNVDIYDFAGNYGGKKVAVIYFSVTGNTKIVAEKIASIFGATPIAIEPTEPYNEEDLNYKNKNSRCYLENEFDVFENKDRLERIARGEEEAEPEDKNTGKDAKKKVTQLPGIKKIDVKKYDIIFLGYPIWFSQAPKVMYSFIDNKDLVNKTIIPFCTSGSSDIGISDQNLCNYSPDGTYFLSGKRFSKDVTEKELKDWITSIGPDIDVR